MNDLPMIPGRLAVFLLAMFCFFTVDAQRYAHAKIKASSSDLPDLVRLGLAMDHVHWDPQGVRGDFLRSILEKASAEGFEVTIIHEDAEAMEALPKALLHDHRRSADLQCLAALTHFPYTTPPSYQQGTYRGHFRYEEMLQALDRMAATYPHLISKRRAIGDHLTHEGRPLYWVKISDNPNQDEAEPEILYTALHHAKEPVSLTQMIYFMWYILDHYEGNQDLQYLLQNTELYFIPCINPDGYIYNETKQPQGGGQWRKNRRDNGDGTFGVDLNRNYGHKWAHDNEGSSGNPGSEVYRGPSAFSEPETQAVRDFVLDHDFKIALNYHAWGNFLIYPYGYTDKPAEDREVFQDLAALLTSENKFIHGTGIETLAYRTNGDADDWMYSGEGKNKIFSMTPEIGSREQKFWPHENDVEMLCKSALRQNLDAAFFLLNTGMLIDESETYITDEVGTLPFRLTKLGFEEVGFTLKLEPITHNIQFESPSKFYILNLFAGERETFPYILSSHIADGDRIQFTYTIDNGSYQQTDTITKYYRESRFVYLNDGAFENIVNSGIQSNWALTDKNFYSEPTSFTDSPNGNTLPYSDNELTTSAFFLENVDSAVLTFRGKWDIQTGFDYLQVLVSVDGQDFTPLCGNHSVAGVLPKNLNDPVYTGRQHTWISERIDLTSYIGHGIQLRFKMVSTNNSTRDGAYIDDIKVLLYDQGITSHNNLLDPTKFEAKLYPNPAHETVSIETSKPPVQSKLQRVRVLNHLGQEVMRLPFEPLLSLDISRWSRGFYYVVYHDEEGRQSMAKKLLVH